MSAGDVGDCAHTLFHLDECAGDSAQTITNPGLIAMLTVAVLALGVAALGADTNKTCNMGARSLYPPALDPLPSGEPKAIEWEVVSLDELPETRWKNVVAPRAAEIKALTNLVLNTLKKILGNSTIDKVLDGLENDQVSPPRHPAPSPPWHLAIPATSPRDFPTRRRSSTRRYRTRSLVASWRASRRRRESARRWCSSTTSSTPSLARAPLSLRRTPTAPFTTRATSTLGCGRRST